MNSAMPSPAATAPNGRLNMNMLPPVKASAPAVHPAHLTVGAGDTLKKQSNREFIVLECLTIPGMDQLVCMRSFVRVADLHSFTRAADALGISRAVVIS